MNVKKIKACDKRLDFGEEILAYGNVQTGESLCNLQKFWDRENTEILTAQEYEQKYGLL